MTMIRTILIANRGEIAVRVMRTARRMGLKTVAVYSDADRDALHVKTADAAYRIGPPPARESYLRVDAILEAAKASGADAIHPGYGFLSEKPEFAEAIAAAGLTFIGPPASAIKAMGLKDAAKALMEKAGVPVVPGYHGADQADEVLAKEAKRLGFPVLIKARAGGGGKGMRRIEAAKDFAAGLQGARREAAASFGDDRVLIERYVSKPRHIEVQVFADDHGNAVHLFERDCSLQRRHQKVIEEAPAPGLTEAMRRAMGEAAVKAARAVGYRGAGTVEFIADASEGLKPDRFYFMEMNTRLQVEHPVTEMITGLDLVEWQIRVANGEPLPLRQDELKIDGHAVEARLYAEDPARDFLPVTGQLTELRLPRRGRGVRVDSGVREGDRITPYYDPMIAKVIAHGTTREAAFGKLASALEASRLGGSRTNLSFLARLLRHPLVMAGDVDTGLIGREIKALTEAPPPPPEVLAAAGLAALDALDAPKSGDPWQALANFRTWGDAAQTARLLHQKQRYDVRLTRRRDGTARAEWAGGSIDIVRILSERDVLRLDLGARTETFEIGRLADGHSVTHRGTTYAFDEIDHHAAGAEEGGGGDIVTAPMPGLVKLVSAKAGAAVKRGEALVVLEAMKMEHTLTAPREGKIRAVNARAGEQVTDGVVLIELEPEAGKDDGKG